MRSRFIAFTAPGVVALSTEDLGPDPALEGQEVLVRSECSLVSAGTELACLSGVGVDAKPFPTRTGYAAIGRILAHGPACQDLKVGDRVFFAGKHAEVQRFRHGQSHQWGICYPVPDGLASEDAAFVCLAHVAQVAPFIAEAGPGDTVAVFGLGVIGNLCAQYYRALGARVIGLDPVSRRCDLAQACGIGETIAVPADQQVAAIRAATDGHGADITIDAVGHSAVIRNAVHATRLMGQCVLLGTPRAPVAGDLTDLLQRIHLEGITVRGAHSWRFPATAQRGVRHTVADAYRICFQMIADGRLQVAPLRSHLARPEDAPDLYRQLAENRDAAWGVVIDWR